MQAYGALEQLVLDNGVIRAAVLPQLGGKIASLVRLGSGREFLLQPSEVRSAYKPAFYGADFEQFDVSGFDECVPTITECVYPDSEFAGRKLPDHGEVWSVPSQADSSPERLALHAKGRQLPYRFSRTLMLEHDQVVIEYAIENLGDAGFRYLWSSHPLLSVEPGAKILLPSSVREVFVNWSLDERLGRFGDLREWPGEGSETMAEVRLPDTGYADKLFSSKLDSGWCALYLPSTDESVCFTFDCEDVPYVGLWICQGGWPVDAAFKHYTVALEPCSGRPDSLTQAIARDECRWLAPGSTHNWTLRVQLCSGMPRQFMNS